MADFSTKSAIQLSRCCPTHCAVRQSLPSMPRLHPWTATKLGYDEIPQSVTSNTKKGTANMSWSIFFSSGVAVAAVAIAFVSLIVSYRTHKWSQIHALPSIIVQRAWSSSGERSLHVVLEPTADRHDWVIASAGVRRTWRNLRTWRKPCLIARGEISEPDVMDDGTLYYRYRKVGDWERCVTYGGGRTEVAVFVQPDAPECDVAFEIRLSTSPSPVAIRYAKSPRSSRFERVTL